VAVGANTVIQRGVGMYCSCPACVGLRLDLVIGEHRRMRALLFLPVQPFGVTSTHPQLRLDQHYQERGA
jgi:hypothetical protein